MLKIPKNESLNIVPFIDIVLVLLVIVLSVSTFIAQGKIPIDLPQSSNSIPNQDEKKIQILIDKENKLYLEDTLILQTHIFKYKIFRHIKNTKSKESIDSTC